MGYFRAEEELVGAQGLKRLGIASEQLCDPGGIESVAATEL
jgi:hypothetical protein